MSSVLWMAALVAYALLRPVPVAERIVLLPSADGAKSAVWVSGPQGTPRLLDQPYAGLQVSARGELSESTSSEAEVRERYGRLLEAQPERARSFALYFESGSDSRLTPASQQVLAGLKAYLAARVLPEMAVIGHTDRSGSASLNDALSLRRAQLVREQLGEAGIAVGAVPVYGRGSREPVAGPEQEPLNRRVEVHVR